MAGWGGSLRDQVNPDAIRIKELEEQLKKAERVIDSVVRRYDAEVPTGFGTADRVGKVAWAMMSDCREYQAAKGK